MPVRIPISTWSFARRRIFRAAASITSPEWRISGKSFRACSVAGSMSLRSPSGSHILQAEIDRDPPLLSSQAIIGYTEGMDLTAFEENRLVYDAVERCLERISEAAGKLGDMAVHLMPDQPWQKIRAFGNVLREISTTRSARTVCLTSLKPICPACAPPPKRRCAGEIYSKSHSRSGPVPSNRHRASS
jgi:hypothetical protein